MARFPKVYFYTPKDEYVNLAGIGNPGDHLIKFTYKYIETDSDVCTVVLGFNRTNIDLTFLQPGINYHIKWGHVGEVLSNTRKVVVSKATYKYGQSGFSVTLQLVPIALYKGEATIRSPHGDSLIDTLLDLTDTTGELSMEYTSDLKNTYLVTRREEGSWASQVTNPDGKKIVPSLNLEEKKAITDALAVNGDLRSVKKKIWSESYEHQYDKSDILIIGEGTLAGTLARQRWEGPKLRNAELTSQDLFVSIDTMNKKIGSRLILKIRDDKSSLGGVDLGAESVFGLLPTKGLISWAVEESDKEAKLIGGIASTIDPTLKIIQGIEIDLGKPFDFFTLELDGSTTPITFYPNGAYPYMMINNEGDHINIFQSTLKQRQNQHIQVQLLETLGYDQDAVLKFVKDSTLPDNYAEVLLEEQYQRQVIEQKKRIAGWKLNTDDIKPDYVTVHFSGQPIARIKQQIIKKIMDQSFYNFKLSVTTEGNPLIEDGVNFEFRSGNTHVDGKYHIDQSEHTISSAGYTTKVVAFKIVADGERISSEKEALIEEGIIKRTTDYRSETARQEGVEALNNSRGAHALAELWPYTSVVKPYPDASGSYVQAAGIHPINWDIMYRIDGHERAGGPWVILSEDGRPLYNERRDEVKQAYKDANSIKHLEDLQNPLKDYSAKYNQPGNE